MIDADRLPTLTTPRTRLRWLEESDVDSLFEIFSDPQVMRYWSSPPLIARAGAELLLEDIRDCFARRDLFEWGLARADDDQVIGTCTLAHLDRTHRRTEVGFALRRDHWGQGYMSEALRVLLDHTFGRLGMHRIEADVDPRNTPSIRLLERLGFRREGLLRERWIVNGELQDALFLSLLDHEWGALGGGKPPRAAPDAGKAP